MNLKKLANILGFKTKTPSKFTSTALSDVIDKYSIVDVVPGSDEHGPFVIVTDRKRRDGNSGLFDFVEPTSISFDPDPDNNNYPVVAAGGRKMLREAPHLGELGSSSPSPYTSFLKKEYNRDLDGVEGLKKFNKMRNDGVIAGTLQLFKTPVYAAKWYVKPASQSELDKEVAEFVWKCLTEYMSITWTQIKTESMLFCEFGYYMFEKVWENRKIEGKTRTILKKLAPRHPLDVKNWEYDENGGPKSVTIFRENGLEIGEVTIDIEKMLVFTLNREANDITGRSLLRPMYKHWYFKEQLYKIDAIQKERHGIGIPIIKLPANYSDADKTAANELGRNLRTNERAHVVLPPMWEIEFAKLEGQPVDAIKSIEMHDKAIRESVLAGFLGSDTASKEEDVSLFLKATRFIADSICDSFNLYLIPELVKYNYPEGTKLPKLSVRRIGEQADWRVLAFAIRNLVGSEIIIPDDALEAAMRDEMDLPVADAKSARAVGKNKEQQGDQNQGQSQQPQKTDGTAGSAGLPRQTDVAKPKLPGGNSGNDKGGQS